MLDATNIITYASTRLQPPATHLGVTLDTLAKTIAVRKDADEKSYTYRLLEGSADTLLKKVLEEAGEVVLAAKDIEALLKAPQASSVSQKSEVLQHSDMPEQSEITSSEDTSQENRVSIAHDHLRYELGDVIYHLLVVCERYGITLDELAAELNTRMTDQERPHGGPTIAKEHVRREK